MLRHAIPQPNSLKLLRSIAPDYFRDEVRTYLLSTEALP
jgi:hypothetical protein